MINNKVITQIDVDRNRGLSVAKACYRAGISVPTYYQKRRELMNGHVEAPTPLPTPKTDLDTFLNAVKRYEAAVRADEMKGASRPEEHKGIEIELDLSYSHLLLTLQQLVLAAKESIVNR